MKCKDVLAPLKLKQVECNRQPLCSVTMIGLCILLLVEAWWYVPDAGCVRFVYTVKWGRMCWCSSGSGSDGASPNLRGLAELRGEICAFAFCQAATWESEWSLTQAADRQVTRNHTPNSNASPTNYVIATSTKFFFNHWSYNPFASRRRPAVLAITGPVRISEGDDSASCFWSFWYVIVFIVLYYIFLEHFVGIWNVFVIWDKDLIVTPSISSVWLLWICQWKRKCWLK